MKLKQAETNVTRGIEIETLDRVLEVMDDGRILLLLLLLRWTRVKLIDAAPPARNTRLSSAWTERACL